MHGGHTGARSFTQLPTCLKPGKRRSPSSGSKITSPQILGDGDRSKLFQRLQTSGSTVLLQVTPHGTIGTAGSAGVLNS
jgi:hypothetical protein